MRRNKSFPGTITDENVGDAIRRLRLIPPTFTGNQEFLEYLKERRTVSEEI